MACPKCGCKVSYQFDGENSDECRGDDERLERCAACRHVFDIEDSADEDDCEEIAPAATGLREGERSCDGGRENRFVREVREWAKANRGTYFMPSWDGNRILKYLGEEPPAAAAPSSCDAEQMQGTERETAADPQRNEGGA